MREHAGRLVEHPEGVVAVHLAHAAREKGREGGRSRGLRSIELRYHEALAAFFRNYAALVRAVGASAPADVRDRPDALGAALYDPPISTGAEP